MALLEKVSRKWICWEKWFFKNHRCEINFNGNNGEVNMENFGNFSYEIQK